MLSSGAHAGMQLGSIGKVDGCSPKLRHLVAAVLFFGGSVSVLR